MKKVFIIIFILNALQSYSQKEEFSFQARIVDKKNNPVPDAYIINPRNMNKTTSGNNGVFDVVVLPGDTLIISHVSYFRKTISVFQLMKNPIIHLDLDTVNILQVDVLSNDITDVKRAANNTQGFDYDFRPQPEDNYTKSERMENLLNTENKVQRTAASAITYEFSPSEVIGKILDKIEKRKKSNEFYSVKKKREK